MKTVRFIRDTDRAKEGGPGFKNGQVHTLTDSSANHWIARNAAEEVPHGTKEGAAKPAKEPVSAPASEGAGASESTESTSTESTEAAGDGDTLGGSTDVGGQDGGSAGQRAKPSGKPAGSARSAPAKKAGGGGGKQQRGSKSGK